MTTWGAKWAGLPGLLPPFFAWMWCVSGRRDGMRPQEWLSRLAIHGAVPLAAFWYLLVFLSHGFGAPAEFFGDQVSERVPGNPFRLLWPPPGYLQDVLFNLMPWWLLVAILAWKRPDGVLEFCSTHRRIVRLALIWLVGCLAVCSAGDMCRLRYFLRIAEPQNHALQRPGKGSAPNEFELLRFNAAAHVAGFRRR